MEKKIIEYKIGEDIQKVIQGALYEFYTGKVDFKGPDPARYVYITTGLGGLMDIDKSIKEGISKSGLEIIPQEVAVYDQSGSVSYTIPFLANVKFSIDVQRDPVDDNDESNPYINGFRTSSYGYTIKNEEGNAVIEIICTGKSK